MKEILRVLIVEDVPLDAELTKRELRTAGISFEAVCVETEEDFRERLQSFHPDIILSDYFLPLFNGMEALLITRAVNPLIPFIVVTGSMNEITAVDCMKAGANDYVIKEHLSRLSFAVTSALESADTQKRKIEAETALKESEERFRSLYENSTIGLYRTTPDGKIILTNPTLIKILGYSSFEELASRNLEKEGFEPSYERKQFIEQVEITGEVKGLESAWTRRDGSIVYIRESARAIRDPNGNTLYYDGSVEDITERKRAEEKLTYEQNLLMALMDNIPDHIYFKDIDSRFIRMSKALADRFGISEPAQGIGKTDFDFFTQEHARLAFENEREITKTGRPLVNLEEKETWPDGHKTWVSTTKMPLRDIKGQIIGTFGISRDITERKRMEDALRESETNLKRAQETANLGSWVYDLSGRLSWSDEMYRIYGVSPETFTPNAESFINLIHPDDRLAMQEWIRACTAGEKSGELEFRTILPDGTIRIISGRGVLICDTVGRPTHMSGTAQDITERKRAEEAIRKAEQQFRLVWENSGDGMRLTNEEGKVLLVNEAFCRLVGKGHSELEGKSLAVIYGKERQEQVARRHSERFTSRTVETHVNREITLWNDRKMWIEVTNSFLEFEGQPPLLLGIFRDITERKRAESERFLAAQRWQSTFDAISDIVCVISHNHEFLSINQAGVRSIGLSREEIVGRKCFELVHGTKGPIAQCPCKVTLSSGEGGFGEVEQDGRYYALHAWPIRDEYDNVNSFVHIIKDITERKRAEDALQHERGLLRTLIDNLPDAIYVKDSACRKTIANASDVRWMGQQFEAEVLNKTAFDFYPETIAAAYYADDQSVIRTGTPVLNKEEFLLDKEGQKHIFSTSKIPLRDMQGQIIGLVGVSREITEQKRTEDALRALSVRQQAILTAVPDIIMEVDNNKIYTWANQAGREFFGNDLIGKEANFYFEGDQNTYDVVQPLFGGIENVIYIESWQRRKDGEKRLLAWWCRVLKDVNGNTIGVISTARDITDSKLAEMALKESEQRFRRLFTASPDAIVLIDPHASTSSWPIVDCNEIACQLNGYTREELIGKSIDILNISAATLEERAAYLTRVKHEGVLHLETFHRHRDGHIFPIEVSTSIIISEGRELILGIDRDITERKRVEGALADSEKKFKWLFDYAPVAYHVLTPEGIITNVNVRWCESLGYSRDEVLGKPIFDLILEGERSISKARWERKKLDKALMTGRNERNYVAKDGSIKTFMVSDFVTLDEQKSVSSVQTTLEDITERKRAEGALHESEAKLAEAMKIARLGTWEYDIFHDQFTFNDQFYALLHTSAEREGGYIMSSAHYAQKFVYPDDMAVVGVETQKAMETTDPGYYARLDHRTICADGVEGCFTVHIRIKKDAQGRTVKTYGVNQDITERKKAEHDLRLSEERFRSVWDNSADGMRLTDREGRITDVNAAFCRLMRMPREELLGKVLSVAYQRQGPDDDLSLYHKRFAAGETISDLIDSVTLWNGEIVDLHISHSFIETAGQERLLLSLFRDVTERNKAEERLEEERNLLRTIIDAIPDEITVKDTERRFVLVNTGTINALKRASADEIIGKKDEDLVPEHLVKDAREEENTVLAVGDHSRDRVATKVDPETGAIERSLLISKIPLKDHEGKIIGLVSINRDITKLMQSEEMLEKERTLLLTLIESIPDEVCLKDLKHRFLVANRATMNAIGAKSMNELLGKTDFDFTRPELAQEHFAEEDAILESGEPLISQEKIRQDPATGKIDRCHLSTKVSVKDHTGKKIGILIINRDITERKKAEEALLVSEEKYRGIFENVQDVYYETSVDGVIIEVSPSIEILSKGQFRRDDLIGKSMLDFYADPGERQALLAMLKERGSVTDYEITLKNRDGSSILCSIATKIWFDAQGRPEKLQGSLRDITERKLAELASKRAEEELRESDLRFKDLFDSAPVGYHEVDTEGRIVRVNKTEREMLDYTEEEMVGQYAWKFVADEESFKQRVLAKLSGSSDQMINLETASRRKDGSTFPVLVEDRFIKDSDGTIEGIRTILQDITKRKEAERELEQSNAFNELLLKTIPFGLDIVDEQGKIIFANDTMKAFAGTNMTGERCWKVYRDDKEQCRGCPLHKGIEFGKPETLEVHGVLGGKTFQITHIGIIYEGKNTMLEVFQDVTEQKRLLSQMNQVQKMDSIGTLAGGIAHDFNNILGIIMAYTHILLKLPGKERFELLHSSIEGIQKATDRGAALVRQILTFARKSETALEPVSVNLVVKELVGMLTETFPKTVIFNLNLEKSVPIVMMDHNQLHQAILNLCVNARDAMEESGELTIRTGLLPLEKMVQTHPDAAATHYVCIEVKDTGSGMDESIKNRIFEPFFTTKELGKGTGLGLSVVYGVVTAHHGFIDVDSSPGRGTSIILYFPVPEGIIQDRIDTKGVYQLPGGSETILIVEDEEVLAKIIGIVLKDAGYTVLIARDGVEGLQLFEREKDNIDAVISDVGLPRMKGTAMLQAILEKQSTAKVIMASGYMEPGFKSELFVKGAKEFIQKPYDPEDVLKKLREVLDEGKP
ncbi:MAG: PAS domain S-box protein [bacterium]